ncbi:MAG TPA: bifunctional 4-hydroxy-2-oxoglutarate aldolase/2-dehydro-3-deoxy-phosphogluconate aldolase [Pseudonocardiaceae bacterium]|nr:bifunctional 4-hydroxy-2-oxoglutarate aldolase/2-dehydro-3-deoxy-phosphogluconate aldolase [Pseudonocardiaceae bacterium]
MTTPPALETALAAQRVLPVLRALRSADAIATVTHLLTAGCQVVELTTSTHDWQAALAECVRLAENHALIGIGTITTTDQATTAINAGAAFLVSPFPVAGVRAVATNTPFIEGGFTPAEIANAATFGPAKVFPAHVGGPAFIRSLLAVLPTAQLIPTGGIALDDVDEYLAAGALAVGIGSGLPADLATLFNRTA